MCFVPGLESAYPSQQLSRVFHVLAIADVAAAFRRADVLGPVSLVGVVVMAGLLAWEQAIVQGGDMRHIGKAFFTINSWVGMVLLGVVAVPRG